MFDQQPCPTGMMVRVSHDRLAQSVAALVLSLFSLAAAAQMPANTPCGVISWWPFDGTTIDLRNRNPGTAKGGAFLPGIVGSGWKSGGQGSVIVMPDSSELDLGKFTIDVWVRITTINDLNMPIIWKGNSNGADLSSPYSVAIFGTKAGGKAGMVFASISNGSKNQVIQTRAPIKVGTFTHIVFTADGAKIALYVNGIPDPPVPQSQAISPFNSSFPLQVGGVVSAHVNNYFNGIIDELTIYNRALDGTPKSEIMAIFAAGGAGKCRQ